MIATVSECQHHPSSCVDVPHALQLNMHVQVASTITSCLHGAVVRTAMHMCTSHAPSPVLTLASRLPAMVGLYMPTCHLLFDTLN